MRGIVLLLVGVEGFQVSMMRRGRSRLVREMSTLPEVELWLDLRTSLRDPESALHELYRGVRSHIREEDLPSGQAINGVIVWRDPSSEMPKGIGDLPIVAVDPPKNGDSMLTGLATAPQSSNDLVQISVLEPPFDSEQAVAALDDASCLVLDGGAGIGPDYWQQDTLPLVQLLAAASVGRSRLLVSLFDPPQLSACTEALVLGGLAGAAMPKLDFGSLYPDDDSYIYEDDFAKTNPDQEKDSLTLSPDGLGVALPPDPRLWSHAVLYKSTS